MKWYRLMLSRRVFVVFSLAACVFFTSSNGIAGKPPPFYKGTSMFSYFLMTPQIGMRGEETEFWVREVGLSYKLPFFIPLGADSANNITFTTMGLWGVTRCAGIPMAETNFGKIALTPTIAYGNYSLSLGARWIQARSFDVSFPAGRRIIVIPGEILVDWDFGLRGEFKRPRKEAGFWRSARFDITNFNANNAIRPGYYVYAGAVSVQGGWGFDAKTETKTGNFSLGANKEFGWGRGTYALEIGAGYEFGANSMYAYVGGKIGPLIIAPAYQTEPGSEFPEKSYHLVVVLDLSGL